MISSLEHQLKQEVESVHQRRNAENVETVVSHLTFGSVSHMIH